MNVRIESIHQALQHKVTECLWKYRWNSFYLNNKEKDKINQRWLEEQPNIEFCWLKQKNLCFLVSRSVTINCHWRKESVSSINCTINHLYQPNSAAINSSKWLIIMKVKNRTIVFPSTNLSLLSVNYDEFVLTMTNNRSSRK